MGNKIDIDEIDAIADALLKTFCIPMLLFIAIIETLRYFNIL
jgi:hypothetical protein